jgi:phage FluMu protein Com
MNELSPQTIRCPYCDEVIEVLIDCSVEQQHYIEDCQVCCRPINFNVSIAGDGTPRVRVSDDNQ